jgi:hypothetical protein
MIRRPSSDQSTQLIGIGQSTWSWHDCGRRWTDVALQNFGE